MLKKLINKFKNKLFIYLKLPGGANYTFSQAGEDVIIDFLFKQINVFKPSYLELGVYYPDSGNNTYKFYLMGARGVLVEADRTLIPIIRNIRPEDKLLNIGVGVTKISEADFYIFDLQGLNTFDKKEAEKRNQGINKIKEIVRVPLRNINDIISSNFETYPDFLSIDIEGLDLPVIKSINFKKYPIPVICAETCSYSENHIKPKDLRIEKYLLKNGYFKYADTYINSIFVNYAWFSSFVKR